jgi:hypothetical protein
MIRETDHPGTVGQLTNLQDIHGISYIQLPKHLDCQTP